MKKRLFSLLMVLCLVLSMLPTSAFAATGNTTEFAGGTGVEGDPYLISTTAHLNNVRNYLGAHFKMVNDIEFAEDDFAIGGAFYNGVAGWTPIGSNSSSAFTGVFDGNGYAVKNLYSYLYSNSNGYAGLFGYSTGAIKNLGMVNGNITAIRSSNAPDGARVYAGGIVGYACGNISNCYNTGSVSGDDYVGGIVGYVGGSESISNCYNTGSIDGKSIVGGIAGYVSSSNINKCYSTGNVSATGPYAGGVVGYAFSSSIGICYNTGSVSASASGLSACVGGVAGYVGGSSSISNCYNTGGISATAYHEIKAGGIASLAEYTSSISNCYNAGVVSAFAIWASSYVSTGGIAGYSGGAINNCYYLDIIAKGMNGGGGAAIKCTDLQLQQQSTFNGFDFNDIWTMEENEVYPYPELQNLAHTDIPKDLGDFAGGNGSQYAPYLVSTKEQLNNVRNYMGAHFKLVNSIEFTDTDFAEGGAFYNGGSGWTPIGSYSNKFIGVFDGSGYSIRNLYINVNGGPDAYAGLFGCSSGTIKNLSIEDTEVTIVSSSRICAGGSIVGWSAGTISNCYNAGTASVKGPYAGGIAGYISSGTISSCHNAGSVSAMGGYAGGIAGYVDSSGSISRSYNTGSVIAVEDGGGYFSESYIGGIAGCTDERGDINNCYNTGNISAIAARPLTYTGGIVGYVSSSGSISACYNTGAVSADDYVGGIAGYSDGTINNCYYSDIIEKGVVNGGDTAIKCSDAQMQQQSTFVGFDFTDVWTMEGNAEYPYPELQEIEHIVPPPTFADIPADSWQLQFAQYAVENGLMAGKGTDEAGNIKFDPNSPITREEFVQVLYNAEDKPAISIANPFPDVADGGWYKNAVLWAKQNDIASGKGNGNFGVGENISRQDLAMMLYKYAKLNGYSLEATNGLINQFADGANVASYAKTAMDWAVTNGIMSGKGAAGAPLSSFRLDPTGIATRAECAAMLKNFQTAFGG